MMKCIACGSPEVFYSFMIGQSSQAIRNMYVLVAAKHGLSGYDKLAIIPFKNLAVLYFHANIF